MALLSDAMVVELSVVEVCLSSLAQPVKERIVNTATQVKTIAESRSEVLVIVIKLTIRLRPLCAMG